jgi:signal peptidase I
MDSCSNSIPSAVPTTPKKTAASRRRWRLALGGGLLFILVVLRSNFELVIVKGASMQPTFRSGDLLLVSKRAYRRAEPQRADIVVARSQNDLIVKRVVGLPGEEVEVQSGSLLINGIPNIEGYGIEPGYLTIEKGKLFDGKFALLGDNRALPLSTAIHAVVSKEDMIGKVVFSICLRWPSPSVGTAPDAIVPPAPSAAMPNRAKPAAHSSADKEREAIPASPAEFPSKVFWRLNPSLIDAGVS